MITEKDAILMQPLVLAMLGDGVQTLFVRKFVAENYNFKVNKLSKVVSSVVNAGTQFKTFKKIETELSETEQDIAHRARNAHIHTKAKNFSYTEYIYATALEAVFGFLFVTENYPRLEKFLNKSLEEINLNQVK